MDQTDSLMVLIRAKATVEMKASLHRSPAVTLTLGQSPTSDLMTPPALPLLTSPQPTAPPFQMRIDWETRIYSGSSPE
ncbi:hypothetical protein NQZ68_036360 [Dissostichus eleginoides]|nr:hypothetical protein NQZ68_036360 [Dissostichus eleginoides]